jgi:hypothetical protein
MENQVMSYLSIGMGLLIVLLAVPMVAGWLRPNRIYGFRTRKTLSSPDIWYPANRAAGKGMIVAGAFLAAASIVLMLLWKGAAGNPFALVHLALWAVAVGGMTVYSFVALARILEGEGCDPHQSP